MDPVSIRKRDEAIEKSRKKKEQQSNRPQSVNAYNHTRMPNYPRQGIQAYRQPQQIDFTEDVNAINFDWDDWTKSNSPMALLPSSQNYQYKKFTINKDDVLIFHGKEHYMSTFYQAPFILSGHKYPNVESYYEACKLYCLIGNEVALDIKKAKYAAAAKKIASNILKHHYIPRKDVDAWKRVEGAHAVYNATYAKFSSNPELKKNLLDTGNKFIVHCYEKDKIFASGSSQQDLDAWFEKNNGKVINRPIGGVIDYQKVPPVVFGKNLLGYFCMSIREELRQQDLNMAALEGFTLV